MQSHNEMEIGPVCPTCRRNMPIATYRPTKHDLRLASAVAFGFGLIAWGTTSVLVGIGTYILTALTTASGIALYRQRGIDNAYRHLRRETAKVIEHEPPTTTRH